MLNQNESNDIKISFRPIRKNVSIFSKDRCSSMVCAGTVFEQLIEVLNGKVDFGANNLRYDDNKNCICL